MIDKFNLILTGAIKTSLYENRPSNLFSTVTVGEIELPGKVSLRIKNGHCSFNFWAYPSIHKDYLIPEEKKEIYKGRFEMATSFEAIEVTNRIDNSKGVWQGLNVKGHLEYKGLKQEFIEFDMELAPESNDLFVRANWLQRYYPRAPLEMRSQHTILILDEKSLKKYNKFWERVRNVM